MPEPTTLGFAIAGAVILLLLLYGVWSSHRRRVAIDRIGASIVMNPTFVVPSSDAPILDIGMDADTLVGSKA